MSLTSDLPKFPTSADPYPIDLRYPANVGQPPFEKFIMFVAKAGRHIVRQGTISEREKGDVALGSVSLYMSETALRDSINVNYEENELGPFMGAAVEYLAQTATNLFDIKLGQITTNNGISGLLSNIAEAGKSALGGLSNVNVPQIADALGEAIKADIYRGINEITGGGAGVLVGQKPNPRTDVFFDAQSYRTHSYEFTLIPRSLKEAKAIDQIINFFQFYMLPSYRSNEINQKLNIGAFMIGFPYEFDISLRATVDGKNSFAMEHVNKPARSVLKNIAVDHAAGGKSAFIKHNGDYYPVATKISLTFQEVVLLGRDSKEIVYGSNSIKPGDPEKDPRA